MSKPARDKDDASLISHHCRYETKQFLINKQEESYLESVLNYFSRAAHDIQSVLLVGSFMATLELNFT